MTSRRSVPDGLWQLVDPCAAEPEIAEILSQILDLANSDWTFDQPIDLSSPRVRAMLEQHRITTLVPLGLVDGPQREWLRQQHLTIAATHLSIRSTATTVLSLLHEAGIETRVLKGLATAELDYPNRQLRHTGDVDLAVRPADLERAVELLRKSDYRVQPTPGAQRNAGTTRRSPSQHPALLRGWALDAPNGVEIDLHNRLFLRSPLNDELFADEGEQLASIPGRGLRAEHRLVHAAGHFIISQPGTRRMSGVVDIARLHHRDGLDLDEARQFAAAVGVESLVCAGLRVEARLSGRTDVLRALDEWRQPDWLDRNTFLTAHRRLALEHLGRFREVPRGQRLRFIPTWLLPTSNRRRLLQASVVAAVSRAAQTSRRRIVGR
jgi:hypothetical protein